MKLLSAWSGDALIGLGRVSTTVQSTNILKQEPLKGSPCIERLGKAV